MNFRHFFLLVLYRLVLVFFLLLLLLLVWPPAAQACSGPVRAPSPAAVCPPSKAARCRARPTHAAAHDHLDCKREESAVLASKDRLTRRAPRLRVSLRVGPEHGNTSKEGKAQLL